MAKHFSPYHYERDLSQVNRFLKPIKAYASNGVDTKPDIHSHTRSKTRKVVGSDETGQDQITITEYNNIRNLYGSEYELSVLNAQKQKAINASQEYLLDKDNTEKENAFIDAQYDLRQGRGQYIANHIRSDTRRAPFGFKPHSGKKDTLDLGICHLVEFTCTEDDHEAIPVPIMARVDSTNYNIFKLTGHYDKILQTRHIMEVIEASQERILKQYGYSKSKQDVELLELMIETIKKDVISIEPQSIPPHLSANAEHWDDTARHAFKMTNDKELSIRHPSLDPPHTIKYRFGINIIIPTKVKVEHNVKTVHRFALDFEKILSPMHIDLIVKMENKEFVWTIHEFEQGKHQIFHTGYTSHDNRLFKMPDTIEEMTRNHGSEEYSHEFFNKASIDSVCMSKNDYDSLLNLHVYLSQSSLHEITKTYYDRNLARLDSEIPHFTDVGYIYKYNHYTIIASGIKCNSDIRNQGVHTKPEDTGTYANFYTIIRWNNAPHSQNSTAVTDPLTIQNLKVQNDMVKLFEYMKDVDAKISNLVAHRANPPEAALNRENFYIPAILQHETKAAAKSTPDDEIGVFFLTQCTKENRDLISSTMTKIKIKVLTEHFKFISGSAENNHAIYKELSEKLTKEYGYTKEKLLECKQVPGHFGEYLKLKHPTEAGSLTAGHLETGLEIWSNYWHKYIELRPELKKACKWVTEDTQEMRALNAHLVDSAKKYAAHKQAYGTHGPHAHQHDQRAPTPNEQTVVAQPDQYTQPSQHSQPSQPTGVSHHHKWAKLHPIRPSEYPAMSMDEFYGLYRGPINHQRNHQYQGNYRYPSQYPGQYPGQYPYPYPGPFPSPFRPMPMYSKYSNKPQNTHSLAAAVNSPEFIPQSKLQAEIDTLKRTLNELTLRAAVP